jgi:hypothetical protein
LNDNTHVIQKLFIELTVPRGEDAFSLGQRLEQLLEEKLYRKLEPVFDRLAGANQWMELDKLEIDLGELYVQQDDEQWLDQAYKQFRDIIESAVVSASPTVVKDKRHQQIDCLAYFLQHGHLPWWAGELDLEKLLEEQINRQPRKVLALIKSPTALERWIAQFPDRLHRALLDALTIQLPVALADWQDHVIFLPRQQAGKVYWRATWSVVKAQESALDEHEWKTQLMRRLFATGNGQFNIADAENQLIKLNHLLKGFDQVLASEASLREFFTGQTKDKTQSAPRNLSRSPSKEPDGIYVPLAGTVLVHPFLPALFHKVNLLDGENFKDFDSQERAVHLLYYIATRQQQPMESEVVLLKLLCGLQPETLITREIALSADETSEAERMLQALIEHWAIMQGTTTEELRGTFFIREGKLITADLGWRLTVEQTGFDVLLGKLPWGLSPIMHPWMDRMLWVEWA